MKNGLEKEENLIYEMNNILGGFVRSMALKRISLGNANKQTDKHLYMFEYSYTIYAEY